MPHKVPPVVPDQVKWPQKLNKEGFNRFYYTDLVYEKCCNLILTHTHTHPPPPSLENTTYASTFFWMRKRNLFSSRFTADGLCKLILNSNSKSWPLVHIKINGQVLAIKLSTDCKSNKIRKYDCSMYWLCKCWTLIWIIHLIVSNRILIWFQMLKIGEQCIRLSCSCPSLSEQNSDSEVIGNSVTSSPSHADLSASISTPYISLSSFSIYSKQRKYKYWVIDYPPIGYSGCWIFLTIVL